MYSSPMRASLIYGLVTLLSGCGKGHVDQASVPAPRGSGGTASDSTAGGTVPVPAGDPAPMLDATAPVPGSLAGLRITRLGQPFQPRAAQALVRTGTVHVFDFPATCDHDVDWPFDSHYLWFHTDLEKRGTTKVSADDEALMYLVFEGGHNVEDRLTGNVEVLEPAAGGVVTLRIDFHSAAGSHAVGRLTATDCEYRPGP